MSPNKAPNQIALTVESDFTASHSLEGFETPHFHLWKVSLEFQAALPLPNDRLIDLVFLQTVMDRILSPLKGSYLNTSLPVSPTSENLAMWIWEKLVQELKDAPLREVRVKLCDLAGRSTGSARVFSE